MTTTANRTAASGDAAAVSTGQAASLRRLRLGATPAWLAAMAGFLVIVLLWQLASVTLFQTAVGTPGAIPTPWSVLVRVEEDLTSAVYWRAISATGSAALEGYLIGNVIALVLAFLVLLVPSLDRLATQLAVVSSCIPVTAVAPVVALLSVSGSRATSVFLAALSVLFTSVVGFLLGLRSASRTQLDVVRVYGGGRVTELRKVRLIAALPSVIGALKLAAPAAFLGAVVGEYFLVGVDSGLGILLLAAQSTSSPVKLWAIGFLCAGVAGVAYLVLSLIGRLVAPWASGTGRAGGF